MPGTPLAVSLNGRVVGLRGTHAQPFPAPWLSSNCLSISGTNSQECVRKGVHDCFCTCVRRVLGSAVQRPYLHHCLINTMFPAISPCTHPTPPSASVARAHPTDYVIFQTGRHTRITTASGPLLMRSWQHTSSARGPRCLGQLIVCDDRRVVAAVGASGCIMGILAIRELLPGGRHDGVAPLLDLRLARRPGSR